jgi:hypothetical protein
MESASCEQPAEEDIGIVNNKSSMIVQATMKAKSMRSEVTLHNM